MRWHSSGTSLLVITFIGLDLHWKPKPTFSRPELMLTTVFMCMYCMCVMRWRELSVRWRRGLRVGLLRRVSLTWVLARPRSSTQNLQTSRSASYNGVVHGTVWVEKSPSTCCRLFAAPCHLYSRCTGCIPGLLSLKDKEEAEWELSQALILKWVSFHWFWLKNQSF